MAIASIEDVAGRWGKELSDEEIALVTLRLEDVERKIRRRIKDLDARITAGSTDEEDVKQVEADAVLRLVRNPDGFLSETDGNYTYMLSAQSASGRLEITDEEWELLGWRRRGFATLVPTLDMPT